MKDTKNRGKLVILGGVLLTISLMGIPGMCNAMFVIPVTTDLGISRAAFSTLSTMNAITASVISFFSGTIYKKTDPVTTIRLGAVMGTVGYLLLSFASGLPMFYVSMAILGASCSLATFIPMAILADQWMPESSGKAIGVVMMGSSIASMIFNPLIGVLITNYGWRRAYFVMGIIVAVLSLTAAFVLVQPHPDYAKQNRLEDPVQTDRPEELSEEPAASEPAGKVSFLSPRNLRLCFIGFCMLVANMGFYVTYVSHLQDMGYTQTFASLYSSVSQGIMALGKFSYGAMVDKMGLKKCTRISFAAGCISLVGLCFCRNKICLALCLLAPFFACPFDSVGLAPLSEEAGGPENKAEFMGKFTTLANVGYGVIPIIIGGVYDTMGSYNPFFAFAAVCAAAGFLYSNKAYAYKK